MKNEIMMAAIKKRKGSRFNSEGFLKDAKPGLDSDDLKRKDSVTLGDGVKKEVLDSHSRNRASSTDDLSPSHQELESRGVEVKPQRMKADEVDDLYEDDDDSEERKVGGNYDDDVYDESVIEKVKKRGKPKTIFERMQMGLAKNRK